MDDNRRKTIKISLKSFIIIAIAIVVVLFLGANLYAKALGKPNIYSAIKKSPESKENAIMNNETVEENVLEKDNNNTTILNNSNSLQNSKAKNLKVTKISIKKAPSKVKYRVGEDFNPTGMIVKATFSDGTTEEISNYELANDKDLEKNQKDVLIYYTEGDKEIEVAQPITVVSVERIQITKAPNKTVYKVGEDFNPTGMIVKATFSDGTTEEISNYEFANDKDLEKNQKNVLIYYTEGDRQIEAVQPITVSQ